mmetsp:Transcript_83954/g.102837  ORF Transcript_83954/g.102837 Transcript_83954/m.102837 type:complete len:335 (-) Transcript_83954:59-1063(-)
MSRILRNATFKSFKSLKPYHIPSIYQYTHHSRYNFCDKKPLETESKSENNTNNSTNNNETPNDNESKNDKNNASALDELNSFIGKVFPGQKIDPNKSFNIFTSKSTLNNDSNNDSSNNLEEFSRKLNEIYKENEFDLRLNTISEYIDICLIKYRNFMYRWSMNSSSFKKRYLSYDEFMCGSYEGFRYFLNNITNTESLKECCHDDIISNIDVIIKALYHDTNIYTINKLEMYFIKMELKRDIESFRELIQKSQESGGNFSMPIELSFIIRYYYRLDKIDSSTNNNTGTHGIYNYCDVLWWSKWDAKASQGNITNTISHDWQINYISIPNQVNIS